MTYLPNSTVCVSLCEQMLYACGEYQHNHKVREGGKKKSTSARQAARKAESRLARLTSDVRERGIIFLFLTYSR